MSSPGMKSLHGLGSLRSLNSWYSRVEVLLVGLKRTRVQVVLFSFPNTSKILPACVWGRLEGSREGIHVEVVDKYSLVEHKSEFYNRGWALWHHMVFLALSSAIIRLMMSSVDTRQTLALKLCCVAVKHIVLVSSDCDRVREVKFDLSSDSIHFAYSASLDHKPLNTHCVFHWAQIITIITMKNAICKKKR